MHPDGASTRPQRNARAPQEGKETMTPRASSHLAPTGHKHVQTPATGPNRVRADGMREPGCTRVVTRIRNARPSTSPSSVPQETQVRVPAGGGACRASRRIFSAQPRPAARCCQGDDVGRGHGAEGREAAGARSGGGAPQKPLRPEGRLPRRGEARPCQVRGSPDMRVGAWARGGTPDGGGLGAGSRRARASEDRCASPRERAQAFA